MWHLCAKDSVVFIQVCCIACHMGEYRLEDLPYFLISPMLAKDVCRVVLSIQKGEADVVGGNHLTYSVK